MNSIRATIILCCWPIVSIYVFNRYKRIDAVLFSVIFGYLMLPQGAYIDLPLLGSYDKGFAIVLGVFLGVSNKKAAGLSNKNVYVSDIPLMLWCIAPLLTSLSNGLGLKDGLAGFLSNFIQWGAFYIMGRTFFKSFSHIRKLTWAMIFGGILYGVLSLYEIRMSPQLSKMVYGYFPHSFSQAIRYGGYRPFVFMQHGLMVSFWMMATFNCAFWLWRSNKKIKLKNVPMSLIALMLFIVTLLCKSGNAYVFLLLSILTFFLFRKKMSTVFLRILIIAIPIYALTRIFSWVALDQFKIFLSSFLDEERLGSVMVRLYYDSLFNAKTFLRPVFGWGAYKRGWPINPETGGYIGVVDSFITIVSNTYGYFGLVSVFLVLLSGPMTVLSLRKKIKLSSFTANKFLYNDAIVLSLVLILFVYDGLLNSMINPIYILISGALVSYSKCVEDDLN